MKKANNYNTIADLIFNLRQKCALKDLYFVRKMGISLAEFNCLAQFYESDTLSVKELNERLDLTPGGVTRVITLLEKKGLIKRRISPDDRRSINVHLTKKGKEMVAKLQQEASKMHEEIFAKLDNPSREKLVWSIEKLLNIIDAWLDSNKNEEK